MEAIEVLEKDIANTLLEDLLAPLEVSKVADLAVPLPESSFIEWDSLRGGAERTSGGEEGSRDSFSNLIIYNHSSSVPRHRLRIEYEYLV